MHLRLAQITLLFFTIFSQNLQAQVLVVDSSNYKTASDYTIKNYNNKNALTQNSIKTLYRKENGMLWLATESSVNCYDGNRFIEFSTPEIIKHRVRSLHPKGDTLFMGRMFSDRIWGGSVRPGKREGEEEYLYGLNNQFLGKHNHSNFDSIHRWRDVLNYGRTELVRFTDTSFYVKKVLGTDMLYFENSKLSGSIRATVFDHFFKLDKYLVRFSESQDSLILYDKDRPVLHYPKPKLPGEWQFVFSSSEEKEIYAHTGEDFYQLFLSGDTLTYKLLIRGLNISCIRKAICFSNQNYYFGTCNQGLFVLKAKKQFSVLRDPAQGYSTTVYAHNKIGKDSILIDDKIFTDDSIIDLSSYFGKIKKKNVLFDSKKRLWFRSREGSYYLQTQGKWKAPIRLPFNLNHFREDKDGNIWSIEKDSLRCFNGDTWNAFALIKKEEKPIIINFSYDHFSNSIWVSYEEATYRYYIDSNTTELIPGLNQASVRNVFTDTEGINWISTYGNGLFSFFKGKIIKLPLDNNKNLLMNHCILQDKNGFFWISSNYGIFKVLREELIAYLEGKTDQIYYHKYHEFDGIRNSEFNGNCFPCASKTKEGEFRFPSLDGLLKFNPLELETEKHPRDIYISKVILNDQELSLDSMVSIDQDFSRLEFAVVAPYEGSHDNLYLEYKLLGLNGKWIRFGTEQNIMLSQLQPDKYTLQIRRKLGFGVDNFSNISFDFFVKPYYYQTLAFKAIASLFMISLIILAFVLRSRNERRKQEILENIIQSKTNDYRILNEKLKLNVARLRRAQKDKDSNNKAKDTLLGLYTHDIRGPLRFILSIVDNSDDLDRITLDDINERLMMIKTSTRGIYMRTERMFNWLRVQEDGFKIVPSKVSLSKVTSNAIQTYEYGLQEKRINTNIQVSEKAYIQNDPNIVFIIITNLLDNALKFTRADGFIDIKDYKIEDFNVWVITDSGVGIPREKLESLRNGNQLSSTPGTDMEKGKGYGLMAISQLLERIKGYLEIESVEGKGTTVSVFFRNFDTSR